jgi:RNA polymerase sigma factor (sigma-70 family)
VPSDETRAERAAFAALFEAHFDALLAYARRRTDQLADAEDVVADSFTVVWRRWADLPRDEPQHLPWLYGIARRVLANQRRGAARRDRLRERLRDLPHRQGTSGSARLSSALDALARLREDDQEVLRLVAWEGLPHAEVAVALSITPNAAAIRIHRARRRLEAQLKGSSTGWTPQRWRGSAKQSAPREDLQ